MKYIRYSKTFTRVIELVKEADKWKPVCTTPEGDVDDVINKWVDETGNIIVDIRHSSVDVGNEEAVKVIQTYVALYMSPEVFMNSLPENLDE